MPAHPKADTPPTWKIDGPETLGSTSPKAGKSEGLHVMVVDDDPVLVGVLAAMVKGTGIPHVSSAMSGNEAQLKLDDPTETIDCVICDCAMNEGNGLQLLKSVRTGLLRSVRPNAGFIIVTGMSDQMTVNLASSLSVSAYLRKPVAPDKLRAALARSLDAKLAVDIERYSAVSLPLNWPNAGSKG